MLNSRSTPGFFRKASRSAIISSAEPYRRFRSGAMAFMQISSICSGMSLLISLGARGMELRCWMATETAESPSKGRRLVSISYSTTPAE